MRRIKFIPAVVSMFAVVLVVPTTALAGHVASPGNSSAATGVFVGEATLVTSLCYPNPTGGLPVCNPGLGPFATGFSFTAGCPGAGAGVCTTGPGATPTACVGVSDGPLHKNHMAVGPPPSGTYEHGPWCLAEVPAGSGTVTPVAGLGPWCGLSTGVASGTVTFNEDPLPGGLDPHVSNTVYGFSVAWTGVGGTLVMAGTATNPVGGAPGVAAAVVNAAPNPFPVGGGESCASTAGADRFLVVGVASAAVVA